MKIRKKLKIKKKNVLLISLGIMIALTFSSLKNTSFAVPAIGTDKNSKSALINEYVNNLSNLVEKKDIDSRFVNIISLEDDKYISKLFNFKTGKEVSIESIIKPEMVEEFWYKINTLLYLKYPKFIADVLSKNDKTNTYFVKDNELVIYYYDYEIDPLPNEELSLHINYNEIKDCMDITIKLDKSYENEDGSKIDLNKKIVALTFDDGPGPYTSRLIDILNNNKVHATFFMLGKNLSLYKDTVKKVHDNNMEIGYHSYNHKNFKRQKLETIVEEFNESNETLKSITGSTFHLIRPPYGSINEKIKESLNASFILWNIDTEDWRHKNTDYLKEYVLQKAQDGNIILFHDIHKSSVDAIEKLLPYLYIEGYQVVTVSELAKITQTKLELHKTYRYFTR